MIKTFDISGPPIINLYYRYWSEGLFCYEDYGAAAPENSYWNIKSIPPAMQEGKITKLSYPICIITGLYAR